MMKESSTLWHPVGMSFDHKRSVVFTDGRVVSGSIRFHLNVEDMWLRDQKNKAGISYSHWAYTDELTAL